MRPLSFGFGHASSQWGSVGEADVISRSKRKCSCPVRLCGLSLSVHSQNGSRTQPPCEDYIDDKRGLQKLGHALMFLRVKEPHLAVISPIGNVQRVGSGIRL